jgi:hypothetical protein
LYGCLTSEEVMRVSGAGKRYNLLDIYKDLSSGAV